VIAIRASTDDASAQSASGGSRTVYVTWTVCVVGWIVLAVSAGVMGWVTWALAHWIHKPTCGPNPPVEHRFDLVFGSLVIYLNWTVPSFVFLLPRSQRQLRAFGPAIGIVAIIVAAFSVVVPIVEALWAALETMMC
jgi:hypothetical protein